MMFIKRLFIFKVFFCYLLISSCSGNTQLKNTSVNSDSAKIDFQYINNESSDKDNTKNNLYELSVFIEIINEKLDFKNESVNSPGVGWDNNYKFYQELNCPEYSYDYLCIPSINLVLPIVNFRTIRKWEYGELFYTYSGIASINQLNIHGKVMVVNSFNKESEKLGYTFYLTMDKGLVAFSIGNLDHLWVLSEENMYGVGALSLGKSLGVNSLLATDIEKYSIVKSVEN